MVAVNVKGSIAARVFVCYHTGSDKLKGWLAEHSEGSTDEYFRAIRASA